MNKRNIGFLFGLIFTTVSMVGAQTATQTASTAQSAAAAPAAASEQAPVQTTTASLTKTPSEPAPAPQPAPVQAQEPATATQAAPTAPVAKPSIAIVDFNARTLQVTIGQDISGVNFSDQYLNLLNAELVTGLTNDPTFNVLDRARIQDLSKTGQLADVTPANIADLGKSAGADYIVCGDIDLLEITKNVQNFPGFTQTRMDGRMVVNLRIVEVKSAHVIFAKKINNLLTINLNDYTTTTPTAFMEELKTDTVRRLVTEISESIIPIQVKAVRGNQVYLNKGAQSFKGGEVLDIVIPGEPIYDTDGSILDTVEEKIGKVRVDTVKPKVSIATIVESTKPVQPGYLAHRVEQ